ncbi:hypothetical protein RUND412_000614 [Rhizina undulata]
MSYASPTASDFKFPKHTVDQQSNFWDNLESPIDIGKKPTDVTYDNQNISTTEKSTKITSNSEILSPHSLRIPEPRQEVCTDPADQSIKEKFFQRPGSFQKLNLPLGFSMLEDPRFDGYCHAWLQRPQSCRSGEDCYYKHAYPPGLVEAHGLVAIYINAEGTVVYDGERCKIKLLGREPGCIHVICRNWLKNKCRYGSKCWYLHALKAVVTGYPVIQDLTKTDEGSIFNQAEKEKLKKQAKEIKKMPKNPDNVILSIAEELTRILNNNGNARVSFNRPETFSSSPSISDKPLREKTGTHSHVTVISESNTTSSIHSLPIASSPPTKIPRKRRRRWHEVWEFGELQNSDSSKL